MSASKPLILVSNDDGITAPGIRNLVAVASKIGDVVVVAPDGPQSGMGHAITIGNTLRLNQVDLFDSLYDNVRAYECSGTPADCVKLAKREVLGGKAPDLVVSGINHGSNSSISVLYSGTMSAAIEAGIEGIPAIGFSLCDYGHNADFSHTLPFVEQIIREALKRGIPPGVTMNANFPAITKGPIKGIKVCRQARAKWQEEFDKRLDPRGREYYWMVGSFVNMDKGEDTDEWALANGYASLVPCTYDLTAYAAMPFLNAEWQLAV
jgi:5'-nucleotidase